MDTIKFTVKHPTNFRLKQTINIRLSVTHVYDIDTYLNDYLENVSLEYIQNLHSKT